MVDMATDIKSEEFSRSVINAATKLTYEDALKMLDRPDKVWQDPLDLPEIKSPWDATAISQKVKTLHAALLPNCGNRDRRSFIRAVGNSLSREAVVLKVHQRSLDCLVLDLGLVLKVPMDAMVEAGGAIAHFKYQEECQRRRPRPTIKWAKAKS